MGPPACPHSSLLEVLVNEHSKKVAKVLAKAWLDPAAMKRLRSDPKTVLKEAGIHAHGEVRIHEDTKDVSHFVIPARPAGVKDEDLKDPSMHPDLCCTLV